MPVQPYAALCPRHNDAYSVSQPLLLAATAGLDVLDVVRGLDVFAACFAYSAATHAFVQRPAAAPPGGAFLSVSIVAQLGKLYGRNTVSEGGSASLHCWACAVTTMSVAFK